jgi:hypothetical protein
VAIEDRPAKGDVIGRVAIAANGHVTAGHHELKIAIAGRTKNRQALVLAKTTSVVLQLFVNLGLPLGLDQSFKDLADHLPLILGIEVGVDALFGDVPVVGNMRP